MATKKYTLSDLLQELGIQTANMQEFYNKLNLILTSQSDSVQITQHKSDGTQSSILVPSFGFLSGKIDNVSKTFESLLNANAQVVGVQSESGDIRKFQMTDIATLVQDLESISKANIAAPTTFQVKNNWFFESFIDPLLYISVDVAKYSSVDIDRFEVHRLIINDSTSDISNYFDSTYKSSNSISYSDLISDLSDRGITFNEDINVVDLPLAINRNRGTFDVLKIYEDQASEVINNQTITHTVKKYKLNTLKYVDVTISDVPNKVLAAGDVFITPDNSEYQIKTIDKTQNTVILNLIFGTQGITQGASVLRIKPLPYKEPKIQINVGYNEREVIFLRPISSKLDLTTDTLSNGFGLHTNELSITMSDGSTTTLDAFYSNFVSDFGLMFLSYAKDKKVPSVLGAVPNAPTLDVSNFKVSQIDTHITNTSNTNNIKSKLSSKEQLSTQMKELDKTIDSVKGDLNTNKSLSSSQKLKLQKDLKTHTDNKSVLFNQYSTTIKEISLAMNATPQFIVAPKFAVRGFWHIPSPKVTAYGTQEVVQFKVRYRYLSSTGTSPNAQPLEYVDASGVKRTGFFSPYQEFLTEPRKKAINLKTGNLKWTVENTADPNVVNCNQLEIPIRKGESVEISVRSVSEAGYPEHPVMSDWSAAVTIPFPADIATSEEASITAHKLFAEEAKVKFQEELNSKGLDIHLQSSFTTGDKYFVHKLSDLASGFFDNSGKVIDAYTQVKSMLDTLSQIQTSLATAAGKISVQLFDAAGNNFTVSNGKTINLFAGNYHEMVKVSGSNTYDEGKIVSSEYVLSIQNSSATPLELVSYLMGGIGQGATTSYPGSAQDADYGKNRRYDKVPLTVNSLTAGVIGGISQKTGLQSSQVQSQFLYLRYRDFALANDLRAGDKVDLTLPTPTTNPLSYTDLGAYAYGGVTKTYGSVSKKVPFNYAHYLPFDPLLSSVVVGSNTITFSHDANVWNGTFTTNIPNGNGYLSEFCLHKDHPDLDYLGFDATTIGNLSEYYRPKYTSTEYSTGTQKTLPFAQTLHFETSIDESINVFGVKSYVQAEYQKPEDPGLVNAQSSLLLKEKNYPIKLGFAPNDSFLVGKYTCGAYLFIMPNEFTTISVDGNHPTLSTKSVVAGQENAINIPIVFQFRCSDKLGYIGGYRKPEPQLTNIKYGKTMGFDIYIKGQTPFSFDVTVTCQYKQDTNTTTNLVSDTGSQSVISA